MFFFQVLSLESSKADYPISLNLSSNDTLWMKLFLSKNVSIPKTLFLFHAMYIFSYWYSSKSHILDILFIFLNIFCLSFLRISFMRQVFSFCSPLYPQQMKHWFYIVHIQYKNICWMNVVGQEEDYFNLLVTCNRKWNPIPYYTQLRYVQSTPLSILMNTESQGNDYWFNSCPRLYDFNLNITEVENFIKILQDEIWDLNETDCIC